MFRAIACATSQGDWGATDTQWPRAERMPPDFDPKKVLEWGKSPGLGVQRLHQEGVTGSGVAVAFIDQALDKDHEELAPIRLIQMASPAEATERTSMHGPAVASLLAGPHIGVAPGLTLYHWTIYASSDIQPQFASAVRAAIRQNEQLPVDQRIRAISISTAPVPNKPGGSDFAAAIQEAEAAGILVVTVDQPFKLMPAACKPYADKDEPSSWQRDAWVQNHSPDGRLLVPTGSRTVATGVAKGKNGYRFDAAGGMSWVVPYVVGTLALGWQVDPTLPNDTAIRYIVESGTEFKGGKLISPTRYVEMVRGNRQ